MARRSDGEKIDALENLVARLEERIQALFDRGKKAEETAAAISDLRRESEREIALLKRDMDDLKRGQERWGQRLWMILAPLVAGACGVLLAYFLGVKK